MAWESRYNAQGLEQDKPRHPACRSPELGCRYRPCQEDKIAPWQDKACGGAHSINAMEKSASLLSITVRQVLAAFGAAIDYADRSS